MMLFLQKQGITGLECSLSTGSAAEPATAAAGSKTFDYAANTPSSCTHWERALQSSVLVSWLSRWRVQLLGAADLALGEAAQQVGKQSSVGFFSPILKINGSYNFGGADLKLVYVIAMDVDIKKDNPNNFFFLGTPAAQQAIQQYQAPPTGWV